MVTSNPLEIYKKGTVFLFTKVQSIASVTVNCYVNSRESAMSESSSSKRGLFHKKIEKKDGEKSSESEKEKKHKRQTSMASSKAWRLETPKELSEAEGAGAQITSNVKAPKEKKRAKNLARRLSFGKGKKKKIRFTEEKENIYLEEPAPYSVEWELPSELNGKEGTVQQMVSQIEGSLEDGVEESWPAAVTTVVVPEDVSSEIESLVPAQTCPIDDITSAVKTTIPELEGVKEQEGMIVPSTGNLGEAFTNLKQLVVNNEKLLHFIPSGSFQYVVSLYTYDFGLAKLISFWSCLLTRASEATRQILVYCICSLIKRYPHCFKVTLKKMKQQQRKKEAAKPDTTAQPIAD